MASNRWERVLLVLSMLLCSGCGTLYGRDISGNERPTDKRIVTEAEAEARPQTQIVPPKGSVDVETSRNKSAPSAEVKVEEVKVEVAPTEASEGPKQELPESETLSNQELLDSALEFCQASNDYWERGDLDKALDALDKAYSLILKVNMDDNPEFLQQKEDLRITIAKRIMEVYASRFTVAPGIHKAIPLVMNDHVRKALASFTGREKGFFLNAYRRSGKYRPAIVKALEEAGFPKELSWLPLIESGFSVRALSRARALGLWQFIASTGYKFGLKRDPWIDERMDPEKATQAAIAYLRELHQIFGDWTTALAAYNCGERAVLNRIRTQKINYLDNFWDLYEKLPRETAQYVPRFMAVLHILNDPAAHGIELPPLEEELETEDVAIDKQVRLETIAKALEVDFDALKEMNAELRLHVTPSGPYALKVPVGTGEKFLAKIGDIQPWSPPVSSYIVHRVQKG
ncbi:MAG: lytic transglycosylase domain-containing protein, partial [Desulfobacterales bacterium]|nr:lytic transglycosylase domain-containing protein [Desulfobacterales bacterium]